MSMTEKEKYETSWGNCRVSYYCGDRSVMSSFHSHKYYEMSLIMSGCVRSLLCDRYEDSDKCRLVLTAPGTPHYIYMTAPSLYERVNLCFSVEFIRVNHSIADACALAISTPQGIILHTGDFKLDTTPIDGEMMDIVRLGQLGAQGITMLLCESTNVERAGHTPSEKKVGFSFERILV